MSATVGGATKVDRLADVVELKNAVTGDYEMKVLPIKADRGDPIHWRAKDKDGGEDHVLSIWSPAKGLFATPVVAVMHRGWVTATLLDTAPDGTYEYCIYDHDRGQFVSDQSHPKIEIPGG